MKTVQLDKDVTVSGVRCTNRKTLCCDMSNLSTSKRKSASKVRTGCIVCKARHIRCDESKPQCGPCQKGSRQCQYSVGPVRPYPQQLKIVMWQPNELTLRRLTPDPSRTCDESRGFEFFRIKVAVNLSGFFDSSFWTGDVLQAAQREPSIHHAVVALASLSETILQAKRGRQHDNDRQNAREHTPKTFAIRQHTKAISTLNQRMQNSKELSAVVVLMTCMLLICFDIFQNNHESMIRQMSSGIYIFFDYFAKRRGDSQLASSWSIDNSCKLSQQLQQIFGRLMLQTILFIDMKPGEWQFLSPAFTPAIPPIPRAFRSIREARTCLESCQCSLYHGILTAHLCKLETQRISEPPDIYGPDTNDSFLHQWALSFEAFMVDHKKNLSPRQQIGAILLEIEHLTASILVSAGISSPETIFDAFEDDFGRIVALASRVASTTKSWSSQDADALLPAFDTDILPPLYVVASRCRHPLIRRQALDLLRQGPRQEGYWHRGILSSIAERIMNLEERDCAGAKSSADIPGSARISVLNTTVKPAELVLLLHCCQQQPGKSRTPLIDEIINF